MKRIIILLSLLAVFVGCVNESLPENAVIQSKIGSLIMTVNNEDFTATPTLDEKKQLTDILTLSVKTPSNQATIKKLSLTDPSAKVDIKEGDVVEFENDVFTFHYSDSEGEKDYSVTMSYNPPPFLYLVKSSDRDAERVRYYLDVNKNPHIVSGTYDANYEGFVDLTTTNWDNICLVKQDQSLYYDVAAGFGSTQTYGKLTLEEKIPQGDGHFPCEGPWGNWTTNGGNESIISPGYWRISFNMDSMELTMLETQWAIKGSAISDVTMMTYDKEEKVWKLTCNLSAGSLKFVTIPISPDDPTLEYGSSANGNSRVQEGGNAIDVVAGEYEIVLDLNSAPNYTYSIGKPAEKVTAHFSASSPQTKSEISGGSIIFSDEDLNNLSIYQITVNNDKEVQRALDLSKKEISEDRKTLSAEATVTMADTYTFRSAIGEATDNTGVLKIDASQKPSSSSYDPNSDILVSEMKDVTSVDLINMAFDRKVALVKLNIEGVGLNEKIASVEITSDQEIAGTYTIASGEFTATESTITLSYEAMESANSFACWFTAIPSEDNVLAVKVVTDKYEYTGNCQDPVTFKEGGLVECSAKVTGGGESVVPYLYFVKTSDRYIDGKKYTIDPEKTPRIVSVEMNSAYEGYVDLTGTNWDNVGLVKSDYSKYYDSTSGFKSGQSYGSLVFDEETPEEGSVQFPCNGPWGDWTTNGGNDKIISPGYWKVNFNIDTREFVMLETQWAISGSAVSDVTAMSYDSESKTWKLTCALNSGSFKFATIPVSEGDPTVEYGEIAPAKLGVGGSEINVNAGNYEISLNLSDASNYTYSIKEVEVTESFMYFVKTSDRFVDDKKYTVDPEKSQKIYATEEDSAFEGYIDLTGTSWDNIGLVKANMSKYFDSTSGFGSGQSYGTLTLVEETREEGSIQFPCNGPWGDWTTNGGNDKIISPGYWKVNFNIETKELVMLETQWAISGNAVSDVTAMTYDPETRVWKLTCDMNAGAFKFSTIAVSEGDPIVEYGEVSSGKLGSSGSEISVSAGRYEIVLNLHSATGYTYSIKEVEVADTFMYFVKTSDRFVDDKKYTVDPEKSQKIYATEEDSAFEGYIDLTGTSWDNIGLVKANMSKYFDSTSGFGSGQSYGTLTLVEETREEGSIQFPCNGPWGDWTTNGGNDKIISPGYWKVNFNIETKELVMLETQWAISGSAVSDVKAMTYDSETRTWKLTCTFNSGSFKFTTIPVSEGDPTIEYGEISSGKLGSSGNVINVDAGEYEIVLNLHSGSIYGYSMTKL